MLKLWGCSLLPYYSPLCQAGQNSISTQARWMAQKALKPNKKRESSEKLSLLSAIKWSTWLINTSDSLLSLNHPPEMLISLITPFLITPALSTSGSGRAISSFSGWARFVDLQGAAFKIGAVQRFFRFFSRRGIGHFNKSKTLALDYSNLPDLAVIRK